jgi:hypothetical protein
MGLGLGFRIIIQLNYNIHINYNKQWTLPHQ